MTSLHADLLYLLLANVDGDVGTIDYPFVRCSLQALLAWEMERAGSIEVKAEHVISGPTRPCPLGPDFEVMLSSLSSPDPLTHRWFLLKLDSPKGLLTDFFARRLAEQGLMESKQVTHMLFLKKTVHPRSPAGEAKVKELKASLEPALQALQGETLDLERHNPAILLTAVMLDAYRLIPLAFPGQVQKKWTVSKSSITKLFQSNLISQNLTNAAYQYALNVQGLGSLLEATDDFLNFLTDDYNVR